jgi:AcrR family transcriptional regulator
LSLPARNSAKAAEAPLREVERRDPARTRAQILGAALTEFSQKGLAGARVDQIAARAGINKRMIYHYFGNKEDLFLAVLEHTFDDIGRREAELHLEDMEPIAGMRRLIAFSFNYYIENPHFIRLLNTENLHVGAHLKRSKQVRERHSLMVRMIEDLLERGRRAGVFRAGIDPIQLYISIAGMGGFYFFNIHTLSTVFGTDLDTRGARTTRLAHVTEVILGYLRPAT